jgi:hypothetical protein
MSDSCSNGMRSVGRRCMLLESLFNDVGCHVPMGRVSHSSQIHMLAHSGSLDDACDVQRCITIDACAFSLFSSCRLCIQVKVPA